jgi:hypothetical protein
MARSIGVQIGLLAFGVAIIAGIYAQNPPTVTLTRGLVDMVVGLVVGQLAGWAALQVLRDHLQKKKSLIDQEHVALMKVLTGADEEVEEVADGDAAGIAQSARAPTVEAG